MAVEIVQLGGHIGSYAGDCAVVTIEDGARSQNLVIDTGASKVWTDKERGLARFVAGRLPTRARVPCWLLTTHFHEDHHNAERAAALRAECHVFPQSAWNNAGQPTPASANVQALGNGHTRLALPSTACTVDCYVPPDGRKPADQNDQSMAVHVLSAEQSFMSFGDMTAEAYERIVQSRGQHLPLAATIKYPHHGNPGDNYLSYFEQNLHGCAILISGDSRSGVHHTVAALLRRGAGAIYLLARTLDAVTAFKDSWREPGTPVYVCGDVKVLRGVEIINDEGWYLEHTQTGGTDRRPLYGNVWQQVDQNW